MPAKTLLIPVAALGKVDRIGFLELAVEMAVNPVLPHDPFRRLAQPGLEQAETVARRAWGVLTPPVAVNVRVTGPRFGLTNSAGAALGLALCPFLAVRPYRIAIAMGSLHFHDGNGGIRVGAVGQLAAKLRAIREHGYRTEPTLLVYADDGSAAARHEAGGLAALNIAVRRVETLEQACRAGEGEPLPAE